MKNVNCLFISIAICFIAFSCSSSSDNTTKENDTSILLTSKVADTTPSVEPSSKKGDSEVSRDPVDEWGGAYYKTNLQMIYRVFQRFNPETDNGVVDTVNIYKVLYDTEQLINSIINSDNVKILAADTAISPTFDFGTVDGLYDHTAYLESSNSSMSGGTNYYNSIAYKIDGDSIAGLFGSRMESSETISHSCTQFAYNSANGGITLNMAMHNNYVGGSMAGEYYYVRSYITGNMNSHEFFVQVQVAAGNFGDINIIGKGISQGEDGEYYVVYVDNDYETLNPTGYYLLPASATEDDYKDLDDADVPPEADFNNLSADSIVLSYGQTIADYLAASNMFDGHIVEGDFANDGILDIEQ